MSINHFSSSDFPETLWWAQTQHHRKMEPSTANFWTNSQNSGYGGRFDLNNNNEEENNEEIEEQNVITDQGMMKNNNHIAKEEESEVVVDYYHQQELLLQKQPLFEKPLTPSDVGKLNRLVIPKQHAEKYFPLNGGGGGGGGGSATTNNNSNNNNNNNSDSTGGGGGGGEKGLLLSFEDELGKPWRFRYSYWNSSQSYVLTKGWSRFVKEKKLDAGDVVLFERHPLHSDRLFIGWRRRNVVPVPVPPAPTTSHDKTHQTPATPPATTTVGGGGGGGGGGGWTRMFFSGHPYPPQPHHSHGPALHLPYQPDCLHAAATALQSQTATPIGNAGNSKRLRLFGVNLDLECQQPPLPEEDESEEYSDQPPTPEEGSSESSQTHAHQYQYYHQYFTNHKLHHPHMDINFSRDVNHTRYHQG